MTGKVLLTPDQLLPRWRLAFDKLAPLWLGGSKDKLPLTWLTGMPTEQKVLSDFSAVDRWVTAWRSWSVPFDTTPIIWSAKNWVRAGKHVLPEKVVCTAPESLAEWVGAKADFARAKFRFEFLTRRWTALNTCLPKYYDLLVNCSDDELQRIVSALSWFESHPRSGLYPRQLPIPGVHTKWLEEKQALLSVWLQAIWTNICDKVAKEEARQSFVSLAGLRPMPIMIMIRVLDPEMRRLVGGLSTFESPLDEVMSLPIAPRNVLVVENKTTGLALEELPATVAIVGRGKAVGSLADIPWLDKARLAYWGDIDTHGYDILGKFRKIFPAAESVLMDMETFQMFKDLSVHEDSPHAAAVIPELTTDESDVYNYLKNHPGCRLEQERIDWGYARACLVKWCRGF